jgi:hypothetical protein
MNKVQVGDKVKCKVTGLQGIVTGITTYLYACERAMIQPSVDKDGKVPDIFCCDVPQLEVLEKGVVLPTFETMSRTGGDNPAPTPPPIPRR